MKKTLSGFVVCGVAAVVIASCCGSVFAAGRDLYYGTEGDDVRELQYLLADAGYFSDEPTGYFGEITEAALMGYQYDMGLDPDGVAGPITQSSLGLDGGSLNGVDVADIEIIEVEPVQVLSFDRVLTRGMEGKDVTALQQLLTIFGYFDEEATGFYGDLTYDAVVAFQEEHDLDPDGVVGPYTVQVLVTTPQNKPVIEEYDDYAEKVLAAIDITPPTSAGYCASWVTQVMENAGILDYNINSLRTSGLSYAADEGLTDSWYSDSSGFNANDYWAYVCYSSDVNDLAPGMVVASRNSFSYLGKQFGHVGIYIGDGQVISSVGYLETLPLDEWIDRYNNEELGSTVAWGYVPEN